VTLHALQEPGRRRLARWAIGGAGLLLWPPAGLADANAHANLNANANAGALAALRGGGVVLALRHALAPGTFDPPGFRLDQCGTQRNLSEDGREQARRIGAWFRAQGLVPTAVRSSPWCRCLDTATLAFGRAERWAALGSPAGVAETTTDEHRRERRERLGAVHSGRGFEVWVTHMFVLADLTGENSASGEGLVLRPADAAGGKSARVLARLNVG